MVTAINISCWQPERRGEGRGRRTNRNFFFPPIFNVKGENTLKKETKEEIIQDLSKHPFLRNHHKPLHIRT